MECQHEKLIAGIPTEALSVFSAEFLDYDRCLQWFLSRYYPEGYCCPDCGARVGERTIDSFLALRRFTCSGCGNQPRATKGTILQDTNFNPRQLYLLSVLIGLGVDDREIARILAISLPTAATWRAKLAALAEVGR